MPSFFLTLTSDEISSTRWVEIVDLEKVVKKMNREFSWKDCPVECASLFHERLQRFMKEFILCKEGGILGKILLYVTRYELQGRGSLHAHIVLWVSEEDIDRVTKEIAGYIPGKFDPESRKFTEPPVGSIESRLYDIVVHKQLHYCKSGLCLSRDKSTNIEYCKLGFPQESYQDRNPTMHPTTGRWMYFRPGSEHGFVIPYHPLVLLLWGAHMNLQRVTNASWSFYLLKYAVKCEPAGSMNIDLANASVLGLSSLSEIQLKLVSSAILSRTISGSEAALSCLKIKTIHRSDSVTFIDSSPPEKRTSIYRKVSGICLHSTQVYAQRPVNLSDLTFYDYFTMYEVVRTPKATQELIGKDFIGNFVYRTTKHSFQ